VVGLVLRGEIELVQPARDRLARRSESDAPEWRAERERAGETLERALAGLGAAEYERAWEAGTAADARDALASAASRLAHLRAEERAARAAT
jgi:hypothetical protein